MSSKSPSEKTVLLKPPGGIQSPPSSNSEGTSLLFFIFGFFVQILWCIGCLLYSRHSNKETRRYGKYSRIACIISSIVSVIAVPLVIFVIGIIVFINVSLWEEKNGKVDKRGSYSYLGCYSDTYYTKLEDRDHFTIKQCYQDALDNDGWFFGLQNGGDCYNGFIEFGDKQKKEKCNMTCIADPDHHCGGFDVQSVYKIAAVK